MDFTDQSVVTWRTIMRPVSQRIKLTLVVTLASGAFGSVARADHEVPGLQGGEATFDPKAPAKLEVKRVKTGHLLVRPVINGHEAGWFIFDTGAGICVVSTSHV